MQRQLVSRDEIVRLVNERTRQPLYGGACRLAGVFRLPKPNRDGCNWLEGRYQGIYTEGFRAAVREIKARYNLQDEGTREGGEPAPAVGLGAFAPLVRVQTGPSGAGRSETLPLDMGDRRRLLTANGLPRLLSAMAREGRRLWLLKSPRRRERVSLTVVS